LRVFRQESFKEMAVSNEILFTRAQKQLLGAKISCVYGSSGINNLASFAFGQFCAQYLHSFENKRTLFQADFVSR